MIDGSFLSDQEQHLKLNVVVVASGLFVEEKHLAVPALVAAEGHLAPATSSTLFLFISSSSQEKKPRNRKRDFCYAVSTDLYMKMSLPCPRSLLQPWHHLRNPSPSPLVAPTATGNPPQPSNMCIVLGFGPPRAMTRV